LEHLEGGEAGQERRELAGEGVLDLLELDARPKATAVGRRDLAGEGDKSFPERSRSESAGRSARQVGRGQTRSFPARLRRSRDLSKQSEAGKTPAME
jgi:hypothetical protein